MTDTEKPKIEDLPEEAASWRSYRELCRTKKIDTVKLYFELAEEQKQQLTSPGAREDFVELCEAGCFQPILAGIVMLLRYAPRLEAFWTEMVGRPDNREKASRTLESAAQTLENLELRLLRWRQVDLNSCTLTVGHSKTESGTGRLLPLNDRAVAILGFWASLFPLRELSHFVFPAERYGASGDGVTVVYESDPTRPIGRWKEAWESAKLRAGVSCRFHDLRHTGCTRMLEAGVPFSVVATIMGWSPSTTVRMARRYGHIGQTAQRQAVKALDDAGSREDVTQNWVSPQGRSTRQLAN